MNFDTIIQKIKSYISYGPHLRPVRDWFMLLGVGAVLLIGILFYNVWVFNQLASGNTLGTQIVSTPSVFNRSSLDAIQKVFADRASEETKYLNGTYHFVDPSH